MKTLIVGIPITLIVKTQIGVDDTNRPIFSETEETIENVLVGQPSTDDVTSEVNLSGKRIAYTLAIPKGDTHTWTDTDVILPEPFAGRYRTIGAPIAGIEENTPLSWNKKVRLERYE